VRGHSPETQWLAMLPVIREGAAALEEKEPPAGTGRPRRMLGLKQGLTIRREMTRTGWILRFAGPEAKKGGLMDDVFDLVEKWAEGGEDKSP
jgi:ParB family transcriptional regulator, chromosome partitioning protein